MKLFWHSVTLKVWHEALLARRALEAWHEALLARHNPKGLARILAVLSPGAGCPCSHAPPHLYKGPRGRLRPPLTIVKQRANVKHHIREVVIFLGRSTRASGAPPTSLDNNKTEGECKASHKGNCDIFGSEYKGSEYKGEE